MTLTRIVASALPALLVLFVGTSVTGLLSAQTISEPKLSSSAPSLARPIQDLTIQEDVPFKFNLLHGGSVYFGYDVGGIDVTIRDNYFASHVNVYQPWQKIIFTGNTLVSRDGQLLSLKTAPFSDIRWDENRYVCDVANPFAHNGSKSWEQWRLETGFDESSSLALKNSGTVVFVRPNRYEPGRGHIVAYNWELRDAVEVDLSAVVQQGAAYRIYNVLNLKGDPVLSGRFDGKKVSLPMANLPFPLPTGHEPPAPLVMDREFSTFLVLSEAAPPAGTGRSFYVSPKGSPQGDGSRKNPWDLRTALQHPEPVRPGDTIWVLGGTYRGGFASSLSGSEGAPIQVRELPGDDVKIDLYDQCDKTDTLVTIAGQHTWYWGFEIFSTDPSPRVTIEAGSWPEAISRGTINVQGDHIKLINLEIHDLNQGLGFWSGGTGGEAYGLIIYNNGWIGPDRCHGHAIYAQNEGAIRSLVDNITFHQFRNGIMVYGSSESVLKDFEIVGNISFANGGAVGEGYMGSFQLLAGGGSLAQNITVAQNSTYNLPGHFRHGEPAKTLSFAAEIADGRPLPTWLTFVENEGFLYGTPTNKDVGAIEIRITASAASGAIATDDFRLTVTAVNDPPRILKPLDDVDSDGKTPLSLDLSGHFDDEETSDNLTLAATLADGEKLPDWLSFDPKSGVLSSVVPISVTTSIRITATDASGATVSDMFDLKAQD